MSSVLVVGLLPRQVQLVKNRFENVRFCEVTKIKKYLDVSHVILMTKFISHDDEDQVEYNYKEAKIVLVRGGMSSLNKKLVSIFAEKLCT